VLWDAGTVQKLRTLQGHQGTVHSVAFSPDGKQVLTGSVGTRRLWDVATGQELRAFQENPDPEEWGVGSVAFSPDGKQILTWCSHGVGLENDDVLLWDTGTGKKLRTFTFPLEHRERDWEVGSVAFSSDGKQILIGSYDKTAVLWDAATGQKLRTFQGHTGGVLEVAYRSDGKQVLTGSSDGTTRLWDVSTGQEWAQLLSLDGGQDWLVLTPEGLFDGSAGGRQKVGFRIGTGQNVVPVDRFVQDFHFPGLLAALRRGERPMPKSRYVPAALLRPRSPHLSRGNLAGAAAGRRTYRSPSVAVLAPTSSGRAAHPATLPGSPSRTCGRQQWPQEHISNAFASPAAPILRR
jgi:hypothetical protein